MFDDKSIEKFRSIKAPEELKAKIEKALYLNERKRKSPVKQISALAACLAVVFSFLVFSFLSAGKPALMYMGTEISAEAVSIDGSAPSMARAAITSGIPFEIKVQDEITLSVSDGGLLREGRSERTEELILSESGKVKFYLVLDDESIPLTLKAETEKEILVYVLSYDEAKGYVIYQDAAIKK